MNQLQIVHKKSTSKTNQNTEQVEESEIRRKERIAALVSSRRMYRLENSDIFYIESSKDNIFYFCKYSFSSKNNFCSCKDFEYRGTIRDCYHLSHMIPIGIMKGKIIDVSALPKEVKRDNSMVSKSYRDDDYEF
jgi:hypothetical protein